MSSSVGHSWGKGHKRVSPSAEPQQGEGPCVHSKFLKEEFRSSQLAGGTLAGGLERSIGSNLAESQLQIFLF